MKWVDMNWIRLIQFTERRRVFLKKVTENWGYYEEMMIIPYHDQEGNKPQRQNSRFIQHTPHETQYTS